MSASLKRLRGKHVANLSVGDSNTSLEQVVAIESSRRNMQNMMLSERVFLELSFREKNYS